MKHLNQFITEYIVKKKLDKFVDSEHNYKYFPKTKKELIVNIQELFDKGEINLNYIDTSNIKDMSDLFVEISKARKVNFDVSGWDVSNVEKMDNMFNCCFKFNCDLSKWDVSKVKNMHSMFYACMEFEGKGIENWDVSNVENMSYMFYHCKKFNGDLSNFDTSNVINMTYMFTNCESFEGKGLENWDVSNVKRMKCTFYCCKKFKGNGLENWKLRSDCDTTEIFVDCDSLKNKPSWH